MFGCCTCLSCKTLVPRTVIFALSLCMALLGLCYLSFGVYTFVKHQDDSYFDAYIKNEFKSDEAEVYIRELRLGSNATDLPDAFKNFREEFDSVVRELVNLAWKPSDKDSKNLELSYFLEGFRDRALCKSNCTRRDSADIVARYLDKELKSTVSKVVSTTADLSAKTVKGGIELSEHLRDQAEKRRLVRRLDGSVDVHEAQERRRDNAGTTAPRVGSITPDGELSEHLMEEYDAGYDLAQVIKDFEINYIVLIVFGVVWLLMAAVTCTALTNWVVAMILGLIMYFMAVLLFLQYGQSQGWEFAEKGLSKLNIGGVVMKASDELRKNKTADLAIESLEGFYKPWYLLVGSAIDCMLGSMFMKLAFCWPSLPKPKRPFFI